MIKIVVAAAATPLYADGIAGDVVVSVVDASLGSMGMLLLICAMRASIFMLSLIRTLL